MRLEAGGSKRAALDPPPLIDPAEQIDADCDRDGLAAIEAPGRD